MQRNSTVAEIFGYLVCLVTVAVFFMSVAGIVNNTFRVVNPSAHPHMLVRGMGPAPDGNTFFRRGSMEGDAVTGPPGAAIAAARPEFTANARYDAARRLVLALVMLVLSIAVFRRTFEWLNPRQAAA